MDVCPEARDSNSYPACLGIIMQGSSSGSRQGKVGATLNHCERRGPLIIRVCTCWRFCYMYAMSDEAPWSSIFRAVFHVQKGQIGCARATDEDNHL
jgi:hypothetical protein